jgi:hypothetical protein
MKRAARFAVPVLAIACWHAEPALTAEASAAASDPVYEVLDPRGVWPEIERTPLSARPRDLRGKKLYVINSWPQGSGFEQFIGHLQDDLKQRYRGLEVVVTNRNSAYSLDDPELWKRVKADASAFIYAAAPSSSTTAYAFKWSAVLERMGIPGSVLMFDTLHSVAETSRKREGAELRYTSIPYPAEVMSEEERAAAIERVVQTLIAPTTAEERLTGKIAPPAAPRIFMRGTLDEIHRRFHEEGLSDGLPFIPPTEDRVAAMLKGTSRKPDEVLTRSMPPEGLIVTVEKVAIIGVMAGCRPEHMPVLLASMEAFLRNDLNAAIRSTNSFGFMQVVNGPIRKELGMNSGTVLLGPGNAPNASMGRALRMFITNLGGGVPGVNLSAVIGTQATWPFMFAEAEEESPWEPYSVSKGFSPQESTLTLYLGGWAHAGNYGHVDFDLLHVAEDIAEFEMMNGAVIIVSPKRAELLAAAGMSKKEVEEYLQKNARKTLGSLRRVRYFRESPAMRGLPDTETVPVFPEGSIDVIVAGGDASPMMQAWQMYRPVTVSIDKWR